MRSSIIPMALFAAMALAAPSRAEGPPATSPDAVRAAFDTFVTAVNQARWPDELEAREALLGLGPAVIPKLADAAATHGEVRVRRSCYDLLIRSFPEVPRTAVMPRPFAGLRSSLLA